MEEIKKLYLSKFLYGVGCMASYTLTLFFLLNGLTQTQIALLFSINFLSMLLFEIPTGVFADIYGHKIAFSVGLIIESFYYLIFIFFPTFPGFVIGMIIAALGLSFQSGANDSLTYEILKKSGNQDNYLKINGRIYAFMSLAVIIAAPIGTLLYKYSPVTPYLISFAFVIISGLIVTLINFDNPRSLPQSEKYLNQVKNGLLFTLKNPKLLFIFLVGMVSLSSSIVLDGNISAPLQLSLGIDIGFIGLVQSAIAIGYLIINFISYKIADKIGDISTLILSTSLSFISLIILSRISTFYGVSFIVFFFMTHGLRINILNSILQKESNSSERSTIASFGSVIRSLGAALLMPLWGYSLDRSGVSHTLVYMSLFVLIFGTLGVFGYKKLRT